MTHRRALSIAVVSALVAVAMLFVPGSFVHWVLAASFGMNSVTYCLKSRQLRHR